MMLVGLSLPQIFGGSDAQHPEPTVAMPSLALNLSLTGVFIFFVKKLIAPVTQPSVT